MIKQIFGKIPKKNSKSSGDQRASSGSSTTSKKNDKRNARLASALDDVISAPFSSLSINNDSDGMLIQDKHLTVNGIVVAGSYEALPSFKDVPISDTQQLFLRKLKMCCVEFDFTDPAKNIKEKEIKRNALLELVDYVTSSNATFNETVIQCVVEMVSLNIFREFIPQPSENKPIDGVELEEEERYMDPSWPHLEIVYEFFLKFVTSPKIDVKITKRYINQPFIRKFLDLFDSEDYRERDYLKTILHRTYGKFMVHRPFIRKAICNIFSHFIFETGKHNGIAEFLEVLGSIISGFALPLKEEHKLFLVRTLLPLHKPKCLAMYHKQLRCCITQFLEKDCKLAEIVIRGLLKYWPVTNCSKEVLFIIELEEVLEATQAPEFQRCMVPLFHQISRSISSFHFLVAEKTLVMWDNDHVDILIKQNRRILLPIIFPALERNSRHHWNRVVHGLSLSVRKIFYDLDPELFKACQIKLQNDETKANEIKEKREETWKRLEELAITKSPV